MLNFAMQTKQIITTMTNFVSSELSFIHGNIVSFLFETETRHAKKFNYDCTFYNDNSIVFHFPMFSYMIAKKAEDEFLLVIQNCFGAVIFKYTFDSLPSMYNTTNSQLASILL